ncbi:hypothetical protein Tco_0993553 [Tanacetum coccineum]
MDKPLLLKNNPRFIAPTFLPTDDSIASLNKAIIFLSSAYSSRFHPTNNQLRTLSNPRTQATIQNGQVTVQNVQATTNAIFMTNLSPVGSINVISYADCMSTIGNDEDNYVPPPVQNNDRILFVIEHMKTEVGKCSMVNQETQSVNESLTSELEQYKERVKTLENKSKNFAFDREKFLDCELRTVILCNTEETLILTEESRLKMLEKQTVINTKPIDNSKLNKLYDDLVPQKQLSAEQLYWSSTPSPPESVSKSTKVFPKKLPSTGQVQNPLKFDECIKRRTTLSPHQIGFVAEVKEMKDIFEQMKDEVEQCSVAKKYFEIEKKQLLINNDKLLEENISCDNMCTYLRSLNEVDNCGKCKSLDIVLLDL